MDGIKKETYLRAKPDTRMEMIFDLVSAVNLKTEENGASIRALEKSFQARKVWDKTFAGLTGIIGGYFSGRFG